MSTSIFVRALFAIALFTVSACGGDDAPAEDASVDATSPIDATTRDDAMAPVDATSPIDATTSDDAMAPIDATTTADAACVPRTEDWSAVGSTCESAVDCPTGYTCQPYNGVVLTHSCEILCERDCDCPSGGVCSEQSDKGDTWMQCLLVPAAR